MLAGFGLFMTPSSHAFDAETNEADSGSNKVSKYSIFRMMQFSIYGA